MYSLKKTMTDSIHEDILHTAVNHFLEHGRRHGILNDINPARDSEYVKDKVRPHMRIFTEHLEDHCKHGGSVEAGGSMGTGGSMYMGGGLNDPVPDHPMGMYHYLLNMNPHQFELNREVAAQMLGGVASPFWGKVTGDHEKLEADPEHYENILRMPNVHAAARMVEAEHGYSKGAGFFSAMKHVAKKAASVFKFGHHALGFVNTFKDPLMSLVPDDYKAGAESILAGANKLDNAINPMVEATIAATRDNATSEDRNRLRNLALEKTEQAVAQHLPAARPYMEAAHGAVNTYKKVREEGAELQRHLVAPKAKTSVVPQALPA